jgi:Fur family ferric uptake transcriptional regulator/Fur family peroxide stress response transcriptional regulator
MSIYTALLKENNLKSTFQRIYTLEVIDRNGHISIDDIYEEVIKIHPSLSLATIYKNIVLMVQKGVVVEVPIAGKKSKYELSKADHIHLVCTQCGEVTDKPCINNNSNILQELTNEEHFKLNKRQINLYGVCKNCQE